ncbi:MAG: hypothetical protein ACQEP1_03755 [Nanobdellota archaeon]
MENKNKGAMIIILAAIITTMFIILPGNQHEEKEFTLNQSKELALEMVKDSFQFKEYDGSNLRLIRAEKLEECENCFKFDYRFNVNPEKAPTNIRAIDLSTYIIDGDIRNTSMTEIPAELT